MEKKVWVYDLETLPNFFCGVFKAKDGDIRIFEISIFRNDYEALYTFLRTEVEALKGYNNIAFDSQIIEYLWYSEKSAEHICEFAQKVIDSKFPIYNENQLHIFNLDIYKILHLDNKNRRVGLKWCEYMIDWPNIEDMPFFKQITTRAEADLIIKYCKNDVEATEYLFDINRKEIELRIKLSDKYELPLMNASNSKIGHEIMLKLYCERTNNDPQNVRKWRTLRDRIVVRDIIFPYIKFDSNEFSGLLQWFKDRVLTRDDVKIEKSVIYKGFEYVYGKGGIHGSVENRIITTDNDWIIIDADVASLYPSIAVVNKLFPEHLGEIFAQIYDEDIVSVRLAEKAKGKNGDPIIVAGYKEAANSVYGKSNDAYSWLQDYRYTMATTINGQLMLTMLAEMLIEIPDSELIQINTDGLTLKLKKEHENLYYDLCNKWQKITNLTLEYAYYDRMMIRDVNNYIAVYTNGKTKCKGAYEIENIPLHKNKSSLINRIAIFNWFVHHKPIEDTILNHNNILDFCLGVRMKMEAKLIAYSNNGDIEKLPKTIRYFISKKGKIIKKHYGDGSIEYLNVHPQKGRTFYQTVLNEYDDTNAVNYNIDYSYYLYNTRKEIELFNIGKLKLF